MKQKKSCKHIWEIIPKNGPVYLIPASSFGNGGGGGGGTPTEIVCDAIAICKKCLTKKYV